MDGCGENLGLECMYLRIRERESYVCKWWSGEMRKAVFQGQHELTPEQLGPGRSLSHTQLCPRYCSPLIPSRHKPQSHQDKRSEQSTHVEQAPGELPPDTSVWKSRQALPGTLALMRKKTYRVRSPADREIKLSLKNKTKQRHTVNFLCHQSTWKLVS